MKKKILGILICGVVILGISGCGKEQVVDNLDENYNKVAEYFGSVNADRSNLSAYSLDEENNVVIVELIENSKENQEEFIRQTKVNSKYIKFEQGEPNYTTSGIDFYVSKKDNRDTIRFNKYYEGNQSIYLADNIDEFYVVDNEVKETLKYYISKTFQTFDNGIKSITENIYQIDSLNDGGTKIYKSKDKGVSIVVCNRIKGSRDVYIGDYLLEYDSKSMCN